MSSHHERHRRATFIRRKVGRNAAGKQWPDQPIKHQPSSGVIGSGGQAGRRNHGLRGHVPALAARWKCQRCSIEFGRAGPRWRAGKAASCRRSPNSFGHLVTATSERTHLRLPAGHSRPTPSPCARLNRIFMRSLLIGIDSGTQSTKALVVDASSGKALASAAQAYDLIPGLPPGAMGR